MSISSPCFAQVSPPAGPEMPSLFYSATERARIEQQRKSTDMGKGENDSSSAPQLIQFNGWVDRKGSKGTIWINQHPWLEGTQEIPGYSSQLDRKAFRLRIDGRALRVGETLDLENRQQSDLIPSGALTVRSSSLQKK